MLWKIFSSVWLYGWKCYFPTKSGSKLRQSKATTTKTPPPHHHNNNKNQNHTENTFSHLPNKYIISSLNSETQIKSRKKKFHNPVKLRGEEREGGRSVLGSRTIGFGVWRSRSRTTNRCCDCDRDRREGEITIGDDESGFAIRDNKSVLRLRSRSAWRRSRRAKSNGEVEGCDSKSNGEVEVEQLCALGSISFWVRSLWPELGRRISVLSPSLFFLYLTLTQLSLSLSLSVFRKIVFEGKIKTEINLHPTHGQLKTISEKCIFHAQPNTRKYGKAFPEMVFTQNKHSLIDFLRHDPGHAQS